MEKAWALATPRVPPTDGEKLGGVTDGRAVRAALSTQRAEDSSESREEEQAVSGSGAERLCPPHGTLRPPCGLCAWRVRPGRGHAWAWGLHAGPCWAGVWLWDVSQL